MDCPIVTMWTPLEIADITAITLPNHAAYAWARRTTLIAHARVLNPFRPASWSKIIAVRQALERFQWVMWMDAADALFMRDDVDHTQFCKPQYDLIYCSNHDGLNGGVFFAQNTPRTLAFFDKVWSMEHCITHDHWEQRAIHELVWANKTGVNMEIPSGSGRSMPFRGIRRFISRGILWHMRRDCADRIALLGC